MKNKTFLTMRKDLRTTIRDKKSLLMMLMTPIMIPIIIFIFSYVFDTILIRDEDDKYKVGVNFEISEVGQEIISHLEIETIYFDEDDIHESYENGGIVAYILFRDDIFNVYINPNNQDSALAGMNIINYLDAYSNHLGYIHLLEIGIDPDNVFNLISYEQQILEGGSDFVNQIILMAFIFAVMSITMTAITSATDAIAGEKEKGTLETALTFPIDSKSFITGKYLANLIACLITALICVVMALVTLQIAQNVFDIYEGVVMTFNLTTLLLSAVILIGYSLFISGTTIAIASYSKDYKEAQSSLTPLSMVTMIPLFLGIMGTQMTPFLAAIPIINHVLLLNDIFTGIIDIQNIIIMLVSTIVCIILVIGYITRLYKSEKILFTS